MDWYRYITMYGIWSEFGTPFIVYQYGKTIEISESHKSLKEYPRTLVWYRCILKDYLEKIVGFKHDVF